jgi:hypothetical protein
MTAMVLAHQGGWDEALVVALPIGLFALLLYIANKRAASLDPEGDEEPTSED